MNFYLYILPMVLTLVSLCMWIMMETDTAGPRMPRAVAIIWGVFAFVPLLNWFVAVASVFSVFFLERVQGWLVAPVRRS